MMFNHKSSAKQKQTKKKLNVEPFIKNVEWMLKNLSQWWMVHPLTKTGGWGGIWLQAEKDRVGGHKKGGGTAPHPNLPQNEVFRVSPADPKTHKKKS